MNDVARGAPPDVPPVVVVGGGFAGVAAAWAAARASVSVVLVHGGAGASALYAGILDGPPPDAEGRELCQALGLSVEDTSRAVATREGVIRTAFGRDPALLDLDAVAGARVAVADLGRDDFDAELLAQSFGASPWARRTRTRFVAAPVRALASGAERRIAAYDLAVAFDAPERQRALAASLGGAGAEADAWLLGPWLGVDAPVAGELSRALARPVGEVSSPPGGAAGARFERRRDALLSTIGVQVRRERALSVSASGRSRPALELELEPGGRLEASAVVLALGGVGAGGIAFASQDDTTLARGCRLSLAAPVVFELDREVFDGSSSLAGLSFQTLGLGALERIGVRADPAGAASAELPLYAAGDVVAGRDRTVLTAIASGLAAGKSAARAARSETPGVVNRAR